MPSQAEGSPLDIEELARLAQGLFNDGVQLLVENRAQGDVGLPARALPSTPPGDPLELSGAPGDAISRPSLEAATRPELTLKPGEGLPAAAQPSMPSAPSGAGELTQGYYFLSEASSYQVPSQVTPTASHLDPPLLHPDAGRGSGGSFDAEGLHPPGVHDELDGARRPAPSSPGGGLFDPQAFKRDFPILEERVNGRPLVWLDNAATTQKPRAVIDRLSWFYGHENSNVHRAAHELAARATDAYEAARSKVARFLGAPSSDNIVFVRGTTEAINLVAKSWGAKYVEEGDEIVISHLEHHANIVPWQQLAAERGAVLRVVPVDDSGQIRLDEYQRILGPRTKIVSIAHVSNALGTIVPVQEVVDLGHRAGAVVMIDGAQSVSHIPVNVSELGADFYVFSGHKVFGPTGIGALYGTEEALESMPPWQSGGNMIEDVTFERTIFQPPPARFEAGTGNIADAVGLGAAIDYVTAIGMPLIERYEHDLTCYALDAMRSVPGLTLIGTAREKTSVLSFVLDGYDPVEVGSALNQEGIAVRAGHHCAQPILRRFGHETTVRPSLALYNTCEDVDLMISVLRRLVGPRGRS